MGLRLKMARSRIGLDIGATSVRAAEIRLNPPTLARVAQVRIPDGAVENGEVKDPDAVTAALVELWKVGRFTNRQVHLGMGNQRVVVREINLPWLSDKELRESLPFQVQEFVPIPIDDAVLDYHIIEELEQDGRRMVRLLLVAAQKSVVAGIVQAVEAAKLVPAGLDIVPFALVRSIGTVDGLGLADDKGTEEAVLDIGSDITSICVHTHGLPRFVRMMASGGHDITEAITRAVAAWLSSFVDDVRSSLDFYGAQANGGQIARLVVTGGGSKLAGLMEMLIEQLPFEVAAGRAFQRVTPELDLVPEAMAAAEPLLAVAVGLAIPGD